MNPLPLIRELHRAMPFLPFIIHMTDGRRLEVTHPDNLTVTPKGLVIYEKNDETFAMATALHITGVEGRKLPAEKGE